MKFLLLAALASAAVAQTLPSCAESCVDFSDIGKDTGCAEHDFTCICSNKNWINSLSCCVSQKCDPSDQAATIKFAQGVCQGAGVTVPTQAGCTGTASATGGASTGAPSGSSSGNSTAATTPAPSGSSASTAAGTSSTSSAAGAAGLTAEGLGAAGAMLAAVAALL